VKSSTRLLTDICSSARLCADAGPGGLNLVDCDCGVLEPPPAALTVEPFLFLPRQQAARQQEPDERASAPGHYRS
jgi:hypothetical protein